MKRQVEVCIISDIELGKTGGYPLELLKYLRSIEPQLLILMGGVINKNQFKKRYFSRKNLLILHQIMQMTLDGTKVVVITGSSKGNFRKFSGVKLGNIHFREEMVFKIQGKEYWICNSISRANAGLSSAKKAFENLLSYVSVRGLLKQCNKDEAKQTFNPKNFQSRLERHKADAIISPLTASPFINLKSGNSVELYNPGSWSCEMSTLEFSGGWGEIYRYNDLDFGLRNPKLEVGSEKGGVSESEFIIKRKPLPYEV